MNDSDNSTIARASAALLDAVNRSDVEAVAAVWAEDGVMMPPSKAAVRGRPAIEDYFRRLFSNARFRFQFTTSDIQVVGDIACERVTYAAEIWTGDASTPVQDRGKGIHVFRRRPPGGWVLAVDIWNSDAAGIS
jgi:uncharacterized protein (TIGR02246 family)